MLTPRHMATTWGHPNFGSIPFCAAATDADGLVDGVDCENGLDVSTSAGTILNGGWLPGQACACTILSITGNDPLTCTMTIVGLDQHRRPQTERLAISGLTATNKVNSNKVWSRIIRITTDAGTSGAGDTLDIGWDLSAVPSYALPFHITGAAGLSGSALFGSGEVLGLMSANGTRVQIASIDAAAGSFTPSAALTAGTNWLQFDFKGDGGREI